MRFNLFIHSYPVVILALFNALHSSPPDQSQRGVKNQIGNRFDDQRQGSSNTSEISSAAHGRLPGMKDLHTLALTHQDSLPLKRSFIRRLSGVQVPEHPGRQSKNQGENHLRTLGNVFWKELHPLHLFSVS